MYNCLSDVMCAQHNHFHGWVMYIHELFFSLYKQQSIIKAYYMPSTFKATFIYVHYR